MFFWMILASLTGIVMFGNLTEKTREQENFVVPLYEAMALSTLQQHSAAERGYALAMKTSQAAVNGYIGTFNDGIVPLVTVENGNMTDGGGAGNTVFPSIQSYLPLNYKSQNNTRTYLFCVSKTDPTSGTTCTSSDAVQYIITVRPIPQRYEGANKMTSLKAIAAATSNSKFYGLLQKAAAPLAAGTGVTHQPLGAEYYILSGGVSPASSVYIPNYVTCNVPLQNDDSTNVLGDHLDGSHIVALSLVGGLDVNENLGNAACQCCN